MAYFNCKIETFGPGTCVERTEGSINLVNESPICKAQLIDARSCAQTGRTRSDNNNTDL